MLTVSEYEIFCGQAHHAYCVKQNNIDVLTTLMLFLKANGNRQAILSETGGGNTVSCGTLYVILSLARCCGFHFRSAWVRNLPSSEPTKTRSLDSQSGQLVPSIIAMSFHLLLTRMAQTNHCGPKLVSHSNDSPDRRRWVPLQSDAAFELKNCVSKWYVHMYNFGSTLMSHDWDWCTRTVRLTAMSMIDTQAILTFHRIAFLSPSHHEHRHTYSVCP